MKVLRAPITCTPNHGCGYASRASGSSGKRGISTSVVPPIRVASPRPEPGLLPAPRIHWQDKRGLNPVRVVAPNHVTDNNALERTRRVGVPATRAIVRVSPRRSTRCSTLIEVATNSSADARRQEYPPSSACERQGCQPRAKAAFSRREWSGVQPRQWASSSASEARGSHPLNRNTSTRGRRSLLASRRRGHYSRPRVHSSVPGWVAGTCIPVHRPATKVD
jgi:hypothetical protein